ncbi:MAG: hypothetical protein SGPRY_002956 [Prymnesium sp.]
MALVLGSLWPSRRRVGEAVREHPLFFAMGACFAAWRIWKTLESLGGDEHDDHLMELSASPETKRRPSFQLTNERGEVQGALDQTECGWGWQIQEAPFSCKVQSGPVLRRESSIEGSARGASARKRNVQFQLDTSQDFYGFVYEYSGCCVAHGADSSFVGLTLAEVLERTNNRSLDGQELHQRFVAAAEAGGGWVS